MLLSLVVVLLEFIINSSQVGEYWIFMDLTLIIKFLFVKRIGIIV